MDALHSMLLQIMVWFCSKKVKRRYLGEAGAMAVLVGAPGVNVNATDASGNTPLHLAVANGTSECFWRVWTLHKPHCTSCLCLNYKIHLFSFQPKNHRELRGGEDAHVSANCQPCSEELVRKNSRAIGKVIVDEIACFWYNLSLGYGKKMRNPNKKR